MPQSAFFAAARQDPVLANVKLIAEPWDIGLGGYQVGHFPKSWSEWNDVFRRTMRNFWCREPGHLGELATRMTGSADLYRHRGRDPQASINHVTVHDGFTLADVVSYEQKHNEANGEDNRDGSDDNGTTNCGAEGPTDNPEIVATRRSLRCALMASLMLSQGVPLLLAGDEVGNSQGGNNNAYCQDNETGWVDWSGVGDANADITALIAQLTALRRRFPQLRTRRWVEDWTPDGGYGVKWLTPHATEMTESDWNFPDARFLAYVMGPAEDGRRAGLRRHQCSRQGHSLRAAELAALQGLDLAARHRHLGRRRNTAPPRRKPYCPCTHGAGLWRLGMSGRFGPLWGRETGTDFRLWAPAANTVDLLVGDQAARMRRVEDGWHVLERADLGPGARYRFRIDERIAVADPASHFQPEDVHGPSEVIDHDAYAWTAADWRGRPWHEAVILELHVGTFTEEGTFRAAIEKLDDIAAAGFTAIELMPVADFAGRAQLGL